MFKKLKEIFNDPNWAPLTKPLKNIAAFAYGPVADFVEQVYDGWTEDSYYNRDRSRIGRIFSNLMDGEFHTGMMTLMGGVLGGGAAGITGGAVGYSLAAGTFAKVALTTVAAIGAAGVGAVASPFLVAGAVAFAGAVVGLSLGTVPGITGGIIERYRYRKEMKLKGAVAAKLPAQQAQDDEAVQRISNLMGDFRRLPKAERGSFVKMLNEEFPKTVSGQGEKILQSIETLPAEEREAFVRGLREKLATTFAEVAEKDARDATTLDDRLVVDKPLKIVPRRVRRMG